MHKLILQTNKRKKVIDNVHQCLDKRNCQIVLYRTMLYFPALRNCSQVTEDFDRSINW